MPEEPDKPTEFDPSQKPYATLGELSLEEQKEILSRSWLAWGTNGPTEFKPAQEKKECEYTPPGVSYSESHLAWYFRIRVGHSIQTIHIPKDDPRWEITEIV
jgi:hypothetical protein